MAKQEDLCKSEGSVGEPSISTGHQLNASEAELISSRERNIAKTSRKKKKKASKLPLTEIDPSKLNTHTGEVSSLFFFQPFKM